MRFLSVFLVFIFIGIAATVKDQKKIEVKTHRYFPKPLNGITTLDSNLVVLGQRLFFDKNLSINQSISCGSCHQPKFAFGDSAKFSIDANGNLTFRNTPPLFNLLWQSTFFWDGRVNSLESQVVHPMSRSGEMGQTLEEASHELNKDDGYKNYLDLLNIIEFDSTIIVRALSEFERSLISSNSKYDRVLTGLDTFSFAEQKGFELFNTQTKAKCLHCHSLDSSPLGSNYQILNNGIEIIDSGLYAVTKNPKDIGKFKTPSLRNLAFTKPYMHDGRFNTLAEVLNHYDQPSNAMNTDTRIEVHLGGADLSEKEKNYLLAFLNTLNDSTLISK